MIKYEEALEKVKNYFSLFKSKGEERFIHSLGVSESCVELAKYYAHNDNELLEKARLVGILHDYGKFITKDEYIEYIKKYNLDIEYNDTYRVIYHALLGYIKVKEDFNLEDTEMLDAIKYHCTGKANMSLLEKILFVADFIEPNRVGKEFEDLRKIAFVNLDESVYFEALNTFKYLNSINRPIYYLSLECYEYYKKLLNKD